MTDEPVTLDAIRQIVREEVQAMYPGYRKRDGDNAIVGGQSFSSARLGIPQAQRDWDRVQAGPPATSAGNDFSRARCGNTVTGKQRGEPQDG